MLIAAASIYMDAITIIKTAAITATEGHLRESRLSRNRRCWLLRKHLTKSQMIIRNGCNLLTHLRRHLKRIRYCGPRFNEHIGAKLVSKHTDTPCPW